MAKIRRAIAVGSTAMTTVKTVTRVPIGFGFHVSVNGLTVEGEPTLENADAIGLVLRTYERGAQFAIGDFLNYAEDRYGEAAAQIIDASDWSEKTCAIYRNMAKRIEQAHRRMDRLTISHHLLVVDLPPAKQQHWLGKAADDENEIPWTVARMRQAMRHGEDLAPTAWWVLVSCTSETDQLAYMRTIEKSGRTCKAVTKRSRLPKKRKGKTAA